MPRLVLREVCAEANHNAAQKVISKGFSSTVFKKDAISWRQLWRFYIWLHIAPDLKGIEDPIPFLQIFTKRIRSGLLSLQGNPIKKLSVDQ